MKWITRCGAAAALAIAGPLQAQVQARDTTVKIDLGGFLDTYYAWDAGRPRALDRALTTTAARHDEVNVNLAFL